MSDPKKPGDGVEDVDWDQALSDWEQKSFVPEVAKEPQTDKPGTLAGGGTMSRPLYRPPVQPPRPSAQPSRPPPARRPSRPTPPPPAPRAAPPRPSQPPTDGFEDEEGGATIITEIPHDLLRSEDVEPKSSPRGGGGGLGQLFSRDGRDERRELSVEVSFDESQPRMPAVAPRSAQAGEVLTSAKPIAPRRREPSFPDRPGPTQGPISEQVRDDTMLDSFANMALDSARRTLPAEEEVDDLLSRSQPPPPPAARESAGSPALLAPAARRYDPNEETMVGVTPHVVRATRSGPPDEGGTTPTLAQSSDVAPPSRGWADEKPGAAWLPDSARTAFVSRIEWLEQEARALGDDLSRSRGLLACSEIAATIGEREQAQALAAEARDLSPSLALAHRQARALMPSPPDPDDYVEALDAEMKLTPAGPARVHTALLAADALHAAGNPDEAAQRLEQAARASSSSDVRVAIARAVWAIGHGQLAHDSLRLPDAPELAPVADAIDTLLRLRGVERKETRPTKPTPNELLYRARLALDEGDVVAAAPIVAQLAQQAQVPELAGGALWLAASLGATRLARRGDAVTWLRALIERGDEDARLALVARAIELEDRDLMVESSRAAGPLTAAERVTLATLAGALSPDDPLLEAAASTPGMAPLAAAAAALIPPAAADTAARLARARFTAGSPESRVLVRLGRLLASAASSAEVDSALTVLGDAMPTATRAIALEIAARGGRALDVSAALEGWRSGRASTEDRTDGALAAALVAERAGHTARALQAFKVARATEPTNEAALRAIASLEPVDLVTELFALADELGDDSRSALVRIEAVTRGEGQLSDPMRAQQMERAHRAAPSLPIASFLAERIARRTGDVEEVLRCIRDRRSATTDPVEGALDSVREALLVADRDPVLARDRLQEAHRVRPVDVALRDLYERMSREPIDDRAAWREQRAAEAQGDSQTLLFLEAAREHERAGGEEGALRCAEAAAATNAALGCIARERAELRAGHVARLAEELLAAAKSAQDVRARREAFERLAVLDATARQDPASALLWHRSILEETPGFEPSLRHIEQHLVGEGRDEELEPIASAIAFALHGAGPWESSAHAELAARLRMRGAQGSWDSTRELVELAASETEPSLWSLRMLQAHSRARGDDTAFLAVTLRLVERSTRHHETATLLARAGEAASRLGRLDEARTLLERATNEDPGDVVAWGLLADVRQRAGDARGAAEACESLARTSLVRDHQLLAWVDAGRIWTDEVKDDDRALIALDAAAAIDVAYEDVFDRLSRLYSARKMHIELASLLERRLEGTTDPAERLALEVRRGRVLLDVGDVDGARAAFESALAERPDDTAALSAFAELCVEKRDWEAAEQALVRLARLLPTPEEQRDVYARLGELYSRHLLNFARAEVAMKEVLRRAPDDVATMERLVEVYKRQNDPARAIELGQELLTRATSPEDKRHRFIALAAIHEQTAHDNRRAEQTLENGRRELPQDVALLRALAEFYLRHHQAPAVNILLDRAGADARRALAAGRFSPAPFEILATVSELRGKKDAARLSRAILAAFEGRSAELGGAQEHALDRQLDDVLAPEVLTPALRALLAKTGEALDAAALIDLRALQATSAGETPVGRIAASIGQAIGLGPLQILASPKVGATCIPVGSAPPTILLGESLADERLARFLIVRALKLVASRAAALGRTPPSELAVLVCAWLKCFNPSWQPQGINPAALNAAGGRIQAALPRNLDADVGVIALEVAGSLGTQAATLGVSSLSWGNRVALLAVGDPNVALDGIALAAGHISGAPKDPAERSAWITRTPEVRDLLGFAVTDAFADARARLGLDRLSSTPPR